MLRWVGAVALSLLLGCRAFGDPPVVDVDATVDAAADAARADASPDAAGPPTFTVVTWNLSAYPASDQAAKHIAAFVRERQPDLLAVQEINSIAGFEALVAGLEGYAEFHATGGNFFHTGFIYNTARVRLGDVRVMFTDDDYAFVRPVLKADVQFVRGGKLVFDFIALNVHLKANFDADGTERRRRAIARIDAWIDDQFSVAEERDYIVLGDFNDKLDASPEVNVFGPLTDGYTFLTQRLLDANSGAFTFLPFESFLDHIVVTDDALTEFGAGTIAILPLDQEIQSYEQNVSDHRPVQAVFAPPAP